MESTRGRCLGVPSVGGDDDQKNKCPVEESLGNAWCDKF